MVGNGGSYQLDGVDQRGEVGVGLVLLNDGRAQGLTGAIDEDLGDTISIIIILISSDIMTSGSCDLGTCGRSTDRNWTFFSSLRPQNKTWQTHSGGDQLVVF